MMNKIIFSNNTEIEISNIAQSGDTLTVTVDTRDVNYVIGKFSDVSATSIMRYYAGTDLIRGYRNFTDLQNIVFTPNITDEINYEIEDETTTSGFAERIVDRCVVAIKKASILTSLASQTARNTADIDYLAMEAGIEL